MMLEGFNGRCMFMEQNPINNATKSANFLTWRDMKRLQFSALCDFSQAYDEIRI